MNRWHTWASMAALMTAAMLATACSDDGDEADGTTYPPVITEMAELPTDGSGTAYTLYTDAGQRYQIENPVTGLKADALYRIVCGYEVRSSGQAHLYSASAVTVPELVADNAAATDPLKVVAVWRGSHYINLHLEPKTQGGTHQWGYRLTATEACSTGRLFCLALCHSQADDPTSYSTTVYMSLPLEVLDQPAPGDSIQLDIVTFDGPRSWRLAY